MDLNKSGYTFIGWDKDFSYVTNDLHVNAVYDEKKYTVKFFEHIGVNPVIVKVIHDVPYGSYVTKPINNPVMSGATFIGWRLLDSQTIIDPETVQITGDTNFYAKYDEIEYLVEYYANGHDEEPFYSVVCAQGTRITATTPPETPDKPGYTFKSWRIVSGSIGAGFTVVSNLKFNALFTINEYNVTFFENRRFSGSLGVQEVILSTQKVPYMGSATPPAVTTSIGKTVEWICEDGGSYTSVTADTRVRKEEVSIKYTLTFNYITGRTMVDFVITDAYGETTIDNITYNSDIRSIFEDMNASANTKYIESHSGAFETGKAFSGWTRSDDGVYFSTGFTRMPARNVTLTAVYNYEIKDLTWNMLYVPKNIDSPSNVSESTIYYKVGDVTGQTIHSAATPGDYYVIPEVFISGETTNSGNLSRRSKLYTITEYRLSGDGYYVTADTKTLSNKKIPKKRLTKAISATTVYTDNTYIVVVKGWDKDGDFEVVENVFEGDSVSQLGIDDLLIHTSFLNRAPGYLPLLNMSDLYNITEDKTIIIEQEELAVDRKVNPSLADALYNNGSGVSMRDEYITMEEAAEVEELQGLLKGNTEIENFDELRHFTGIKYIKDNEFDGCFSLESTILPETLVGIGNGAFNGCSKIQRVGATDNTITIPDSVEYIGDMAFSGCNDSGLTNVYIGSGLTGIGVNPWVGCENITGKSVSEENSLFRSEQEEIICGYTLVSGNISVESPITSASSYVTIGDYAYSNSSIIKDINLSGTNIQVIADSAFKDDVVISSITTNDIIFKISDNAFENVGTELPEGQHIEFIYDGDVDDIKGSAWGDIVTNGDLSGSTIYGKIEPLKFEQSEMVNDVTYISFNMYTTSAIEPVLEYSYDTQSWSAYTIGYEIGIDNRVAGRGQVYFRGMNASGFSGDYRFSVSGAQCKLSGKIMSLINYNEEINEIPANACFRGLFEQSDAIVDARSLELTPKILSPDCYGQMFSFCTNLLYGPSLPTLILDTGCYRDMFSNCTSLAAAPELPATTLANYCYYRMFSNCTSLAAAPELPATTLAPHCYSGMFGNCTNLTIAPVLPSTTLMGFCYYSMFKNCTSLTIAPELPATTLAVDCYQYMFYGCTSLTTAPELPATILAGGCYREMFYNCTNLNHIKCLATDISATNCTTDWVKNVSGSGEFVKSIFMEDWPVDSVDGIPSGWTVINSFEPQDYITFTAIEDSVNIGVLPISNQMLAYSIDDGEGWFMMTSATTESMDSGDTMLVCGMLTGNNTSSDYTSFIISGGCVNVSGNLNSLWNYNDLNADLRNNCGRKLFSGCKINDASELILGTPITTLAQYCYYGMFYNCTSLTTAPELPATTLADYCYQFMFYNCTSLTTSPELPATTLANGCYYGMFQECTSLTTAPVLPATTLANGCYWFMFEGCSRLAIAPDLQATTLANHCCYQMFAGCTALETAPALLATTLDYYCYQNMFQGCTSLTTTPELPATTLAYGCYQSMFYGCTSLTTVPELPATTLSTGCYSYMFEGCTNLNYIKCLATDISAEDCTFSWVEAVSSSGVFIKDISMDDWQIDSNSGIPSGWTVETYPGYITFTSTASGSHIGLKRIIPDQTIYYRINGTGNFQEFTTANTFTLNSGNTLDVCGMLEGDNENVDSTTFIISGGSVNVSGNINYLFNMYDANAPLKTACGSYLFSDVDFFNPGVYHSSLKDASALRLPSNNLSFECYQGMFRGCTGLTGAPELPAEELAPNCYTEMFHTCHSLINAPELPATGLASDCYSSMFVDCTSLVIAPELPAETLVDYCYGYMFDGCSNLSRIKCLATDITAYNCTRLWVRGVSSNGEFYSESSTVWPVGEDGVPTGWSVIAYSGGGGGG